MKKVNISELEDGWIVKISAKLPENNLVGKVVIRERDYTKTFIRLLFSENDAFDYDEDLTFLEGDVIYKMSREEYFLEYEL